MSTSDYKKELEDQHLEMMIRIALRQKEEEKIRELIESPDPDLTPEMERAADNAYIKALRKSNDEAIADRKGRRNQTIRRVMSGGLRIAAAIALIIVIVTPIAIATSSSLRARVLKLMMELDEERNEANFSFVEDVNASFDVPGEWKGKFFPAYLPENIWQSFINEEGTDIEFEGDGSKKISFSELDERASLMAGTEGAEIETMNLSNGSAAVIIEDIREDWKTVSVMWSADEKWFDLVTYGYSREETLKIADSVTRIIQ